MPVGLALADHLMSCHLAQGVTALLVRHVRTGRGGLVETSLLEAMLDLQFELLTARLNGPELLGERGPCSADAYRAAPYGVYPTSDGYLAIALRSAGEVGALVGDASIAQHANPASGSDGRDGRLCRGDPGVADAVEARGCAAPDLLGLAVVKAICQRGSDAVQHPLVAARGN